MTRALAAMITVVVFCGQATAQVELVNTEHNTTVRLEIDYEDESLLLKRMMAGLAPDDRMLAIPLEDINA